MLVRLSYCHIILPAEAKGIEPSPGLAGPVFETGATNQYLPSFHFARRLQARTSSQASVLHIPDKYRCLEVRFVFRLFLRHNKSGSFDHHVHQTYIFGEDVDQFPNHYSFGTVEPSTKSSSNYPNNVFGFFSRFPNRQ